MTTRNPNDALMSELTKKQKSIKDCFKVVTKNNRMIMEVAARLARGETVGSINERLFVARNKSRDPFVGDE